VEREVTSSLREPGTDHAAAPDDRTIQPAALTGCLTCRPGIDGTVQPAPNQRIDIGATVRELDRAPRLGRMPLIVITAGILQERWLKTVPGLEARAQARLASLSADSIRVLDRGAGHLLPALDPQIIIAAAQAVLAAAASGHPLAPCS
jgi:hypothetical protein